MRYANWVVIFIALALSPGCRPRPGGKPDDLQIKQVARPGALRSLGATDTYYQVSGVPPKGAKLAIPLEAEQRFLLTPESMRLAVFDEKTKAFQILEDSKFDVGRASIVGVAPRNGVYTIIGRSSLPHVFEFQERLCPDVLRLGAGGIGQLPPICPLILCPALEAQAWSEAFSEQGLPIGEGPMQIGISNVCDECTRGAFGHLDYPECRIPPESGLGTPVVPPELEHMPIDVRHGGRAVSVAIHPTDESQMLVASETGGLFRTRDGAEHWRHVSRATSFRFTDVHYYPPNPQVIVAGAAQLSAVESRGGIWRSEDGGGSWSKAAVVTPTADCLSTLSVYAIDFEADTNRFWAGTSCGVAFSDDAGENWQYPATGARGRVDAVFTPGGNHITTLAGATVTTSIDGGSVWNSSAAGLPDGRTRGVHNSLAISPLNREHIFYTSYRWFRVDGEWQRERWLFLSTDNGQNWQEITRAGGINRPTFVRTTAATGSTYTLYWGDGVGLKRATVTHGSTPSVGEFTTLSLNHADPSDVGFGGDGKTPLLLTTDGGLHVTEDDGATWQYAGDMGRGYNALQITEVTGQLQDGAPPHLYFGTQDNDIIASPNGGITWPERRCCEGFFLGVRRDPAPADESKVTGVSCAGCMNFMADPVLYNEAAWPNPSPEGGNPKLVKPSHYVQKSSIAGVTTLFNLTENTGASWVPRFGFDESTAGFPHTAGDADDPVVFMAFRDAGSTSEGEPLYGIKKVTGVLGTETPVISEIPGVGGLGTFPTMFAWYRPFGVDPDDPNRLLVPDVTSDKAKLTNDGGAEWTDLDALTRMVTEGGSLKFHWKQFGQISHVAFNPGCDGHILVGTQQAGIFQSHNGGVDWRKVRNSEKVPFVSSFFFSGRGEVVLSSYGRGLWRLRHECPTGPVGSLRPPFRIPVLWRRGVITPVPSIDLPPTCPECSLVVAKGGRITGLDIDPRSGNLRTVHLSAGTLVDSRTGREVKMPFNVAVGGSAATGEELSRLLKAGNEIHALFVRGKTFEGAVLGGPNVALPPLPQTSFNQPYIRVQLAETHGTPAEDLKKIVVVGQNFQRNATIRVSVDGQQIKVPRPRFDRQGRFTLELPPNFEIGGHTLRVEQTVRGKPLFAVAAFNLTTKDEAGKRRRP